MCDCYGHECDWPGCEFVIPMHLGDFDTERDEIRVYCHAHMPSDDKRWLNARVFAYMTFKKSRLIRDEHGNYLQIPRPDRIEVCTIKDMTDNAKHNREQNHPNEGHFIVVEER